MSTKAVPELTFKPNQDKGASVPNVVEPKVLLNKPISVVVGEFPPTQLAPYTIEVELLALTIALAIVTWAVFEKLVLFTTGIIETFPVVVPAV